MQQDNTTAAVYADCGYIRSLSPHWGHHIKSNNT